MGYFKIDELCGGKTGMACEGCRLFASCEPLKYLEGDTIMLCGHCQKFCDRFANKLVREKVKTKKLKGLLLTWREHKYKAGDALNCW